MKILFQGDSITETDRDKSDPTNLGIGYPKYAAERIAAHHPDIDFTFYNLGISGNMTESLRDRWQTDCIDYSPDFVSILVGVNDTWHGDYVKSWVPNEHYEACYRHCLEEIKNKTNAKILILEQFLVPPCLLLSHARPDFDAKKQITRKLAREYADAFIPLDGIFAAHSLQVDPIFWAKDGIHPTAAGAQLIADLYVDAEDYEHACISTWEGDYADIRMWTKGTYEDAPKVKYNNGVTDPSAVVAGNTNGLEYAFGRDEASSITCYEYKIAWADLTGGAQEEFALRISLGYGTETYVDNATDYPPFIGSMYFGYADLTKGERTNVATKESVFQGNIMIPSGEKPAPVVETEAEVVETPAEEAAAPQTFDAGIIAAAAAVISLAGYTLSKKSR